MAASTREKQTTALKQMFNFNIPPTKASMSEPQWKVLVYDRWGQDIISPLLSVSELRDMGVTLHLLLHSDREAIPDVPAIYFVMPTKDNIERIGRDLQAQLYESVYINFISAVSRQHLEELAQSALHAGAVTQVHKVFDQYLNFISLEDDMFTLRHQNSGEISYYAMNRAATKDVEIEMIIDTVVDSLFSLFVTLGSVPIIRCPRGNAAASVSEKLDKKIRDNLRDTRNNLFTSDSMHSGSFSFQRPLLVIVDRQIDLATPFHHTWTYQAMAHDTLTLQLNRVEIEESTSQSSHHGATAAKKKKQYNLNSTDKFWHTHKGSPFPTVAEAVQEELESYRAQEGDVKRLKAAVGMDGEGEEAAASLFNDNTAKLTSAVSSLPELLEKKRLIDIHMNIVTALLDQIKERKLDIYFETEERLMSKSALDKSIMDIISDPDAGLKEDKVRLFLIYLLCGPTMSDSDIDQYCAKLSEQGCDVAPIAYIRRWKMYSKALLTPGTYSGGGIKTVSMMSKFMSQASQFAFEGVKNFVVKKHNLPVTKVVDTLMEQKSGQEANDYLYFDPKMLRPNDSSVPRNRSPFQEAIVFVVGGGNYIEYQNLQDYVKNKANPASKRIIYGCTELLNASAFLKQLSELGSEM